MTMRTTISSIVAALILATSSASLAQPIPKGSVIQAEGDPPVTTVVKEPSFLVVRSDLDYYNSLQEQHKALTASLKDCELQVTKLRQDPIEGDDFWDSKWGTAITYTAYGLGLGAAFATGYTLGK